MVRPRGLHLVRGLARLLEGPNHLAHLYDLLLHLLKPLLATAVSELSQVLQRLVQ